MNKLTDAIRKGQSLAFEEILKRTSGNENKMPCALLRNPGSQMQIPRKKTEEELAKEKLVELAERITESDGIDEEEAISLAFIYTVLVPGENGKISISRMKNFMDNVISPEDPDMAQKIKKFFDVNGESKADKKEQRIYLRYENYLNGFRTVANSYMYSKQIAEAMNKIAPKLDAPEDMDVVTRVKWLRLWIAVIRDQNFFWTDFDSKYQLVSSKNTAECDRMHFLPETLIMLEDKYFSHIEDRSISLEMIEALIELYPESTKNAVLRFTELDGLNRPDSSKLATIREDVKKKLFPNHWLANSEYFCTTGGLSSFDFEKMVKVIDCYNNGGVETMPTFEVTMADPFRNLKNKKVKAYEYAKVNIGGMTKTAGVTCTEEMMMYLEAYKYFERHADFKFGEEQKTLAEYGALHLLDEKVDLDESIVYWISVNGFARDEEDINWNLVEKILKPQDNAELFQKYFNGDIDSDEVFELIGFNSESQAVACFSKASKLSANDANKMPQALKRIKTFGIKSAIKSDVIYAEIFKYLLEYNKDALPKGIMVYAGKI